MGEKPRFFVAVASADHVSRGRQGGFMQVCHGKAAPLKRIHPGDGVLYYSPSRHMGGKEPYQAFTAAGWVLEGDPYDFDMGGGFVPFRRNVDWLETRDLPIRPLLQHLDFTSGKANWGAPFRYGLFEISVRDFEIVNNGMKTGQGRPNARG